MRRFIAVCAIAALGFAAPSVAFAGMCEGRVRGLSATYNQKTGSGFLAVRLRPSAASRKMGELYNGERVEIFRRRGAWYRIAALDKNLEGWVFDRYIWNECRY